MNDNKYTARHRCPRAALALSALWAFAVGAEPFAYIPNAGDDNVSVIDLATNLVVDTIAVGSIPSAVWVSPDGASVYVLNQTSQSVSVIDSASNTVRATIPVGPTPFGVTVTPDGTRAYVANRDEGTGSVTVIDTTTDTVSATIPLEFGPGGVTVHPDGTRLYVPVALSQDLAVIDTASNTIIARVPIGEPLTQYLAVNPSGSELWLSKLQGEVLIIDTASNTVIDSVAIGAPTGIAFTSDGARAYVGNGLDATVAVVDPATRTVLSSAFVGNGPVGVAVHPDDSRYYVAASQSDWVVAFDAATDTAIEFITVGDSPQGYGMPITPLQGIGGEVVQQSLLAAICTNLTSAQTVTFALPAGSQAWDCEARGLVAAPGETIRTVLLGAPDAQAGVGGSVTQQTLLAVVCINQTQGQVVPTGLLPTGTTSWNCSDAGLAVSPGEVVRTVLFATAE